MDLQVNYRKLFKWILVFIVLTVLAIIYKTYNPIDSIYFPKCPFKLLTGLYCPGCGSQRAIHYLLNFEIFNAMKENVMLVISIPYILTGFVFDSIKNPKGKVLKWRNILFGQKAILIVLILVISFWILRNIL